MHVADVFSYRTVDGQTGAVHDVLRVHGETHAYPIGISVGPKHVLLTSWFSNTVEKVDRKTGKLVATLGEFAAPVDALETADGTIYVAELASSQPRQGERRRQAALAPSPRSCAGRWRWRSGTGDLIYVTEIAAGAVAEIDVATGARRVVADGLAGPEGIDGRARRTAVRGRGRPEARGRHRSRDRRQDGDRLQPRYRPAALSRRPAGAWCRPASRSAPAGTVYVSSDIRNALYKLTPPQRR